MQDVNQTPELPQVSEAIEASNAPAAEPTPAAPATPELGGVFKAGKSKKPMNPMLWVYIVLAIIIIAGGGYFAWAKYGDQIITKLGVNKTETNKIENALEEKLPLSYLISGGLGGTDINLTINKQGDIDFEDSGRNVSQKRKMSVAEVSSLNDLVKQIDFKTLEKDYSYSCQSLSCNIDYPTATLTIDNQTTAWTNLDESAPKSLKDLISFLNQIIKTATITADDTASDTDTSTTATTTDETAGWKTYENSSLKSFTISFKYPDDWVIADQTQTKDSYFTIAKTKSDLDNGDYIQLDLVGGSGDMSAYGSKNGSSTTSTINGVEVVSQKYSRAKFAEHGGQPGTDYFNFWIYSSDGSKLIEYSAVYDQMFSTFKITK